MKRLTTHLIVAALTFVIGVAAFAFVVYREQVDVTEARELNLPPISFCELSLNKEIYMGKVIRLRTVVSLNWRGEIWYRGLSDDPNCWGWVYLADAPEAQESLAKAKQAFGGDESVAEDRRPFFQTQVRMTLLGEVNRENKVANHPSRSADFQFVIYRIEEMEFVGHERCDDT